MATATKPVKNKAAATAVAEEPVKKAAPAAKKVAKAAPAVTTAAPAADPKPVPVKKPKVVKAAAPAEPADEVIEAEEATESTEAESANAMGRAELASAIREKVHAEGLALPEKLALAVVKAFEATVADAVAFGRDITLPGFGKFTVKHRPARTGRNPQTGAETPIAASYVPVFKPGKALKDSANTRDAAAVE